MSSRRVRGAGIMTTGTWMVLGAGLACMPAAVIYAGGSCVTTNTGAPKACEKAGLTTSGDCDPIVTENGDCPQVNYDEEGSSTPTSLEAKCIYQLQKKNPSGGGCVNDGPQATYTAKCQQAGGGPCPVES